MNECKHRGQQTGERECKTCGGHVKMKVFECPYHADGVTIRNDCARCLIPGKTHIGPVRSIVLSPDGYRVPQTDRIVAATEGAVKVPSTYDPDAARTIDQAKAHGAQAIIRWDEQGCMMGSRRAGKRLSAACYESGIAPVALDYGALDHYACHSYDLYLPDGRSHIVHEFPNMPASEPDWSMCDPKTRAYVERIRALYAQAKAMPPLEGTTPGYVAIFAQCSASMSRLPVNNRDSKGRASDYLFRAYDELNKAGVPVVIKFGPIGAKDVPEGFPADVPHFRAGPVGSDENTLLNARIAVHARNVLIICSSVVNEFLLTGIPVMATGKSWFNGLGVYDEAKDWPDVARTATVNVPARNKYLQWWVRHQWYPEQAAGSLAERITEFHAIRRQQRVTSVTAVYAPDVRMETHTTRCLSLLQRQLPFARRIAAVDLASDGYIAKMRDTFGCEIQRPTDGKPPRMTSMLRTALDSCKTPYFLTVENDVTPNHGCVDALIEAMDAAAPNVVAVQAVCVNAGRVVYPSRHRVTDAQFRKGGVYDDPRQPTFSCTLWRTDALKQADWSGIHQLCYGDADLWQKIRTVRPDAKAISVCAATCGHVGHAARLPNAPRDGDPKPVAKTVVPPVSKPKPKAENAHHKAILARWSESSAWMKGHSQHAREYAEWHRRVSAIKPKVYVEIGSNAGRALWLIQDALEPGARIVSVDQSHITPRGTDINVTLGKLRANGFDVRFVEGDSHDPDTVAKVAAECGGPADACFIDGDHTFEGVTSDYKQYRHLVRPGGLIGLHDIANKTCGVRQLWDVLKTEPGASEVVYQQSMGIGMLQC